MSLLRLKALAATVAVLVAGSIASRAAPPPGYYAAAEGQAGVELRQTLHNIVRAHNVIPYSSSTKLDTSDALKVLDRDPANSNNVILTYSGLSALASTFGQSSGWNREHLWCDSYGLDGRPPAYSDLHNLRACDASVNSSRGNKYYDTSDTNSPGYKLPAYAEAPTCSADSDSWEPSPEQRGDIARALFYMATRYTGDVAGEPALILTDDTPLIVSTNSYMGKLSTLLTWHLADPVDVAEQLRNDLVYALYQTNRNPFVDHPAWVNLTFAPPYTNAPTLAISLVTNGAVLSWMATNQSCHVEFSTNTGTGWSALTNTPALTNAQFSVCWTNRAVAVLFRLRVLP